MPYDDKGYPILSYTTETGQPELSYAEKQKAREAERRISAGEYNPRIDITWDDLP